MKRDFTLLLLFVVFLAQFVSGQCHPDSAFREYHCLYPEMLEIEDSVVNIRITGKPYPDSLKYYQFMYSIENNQVNQKQAWENMPARNFMWLFMTHRLTINCKLFTGSIRIAQKYHIWGVENRHSGNAILEIHYEKGRIIKTEKIPDPVVNWDEMRKMW